MASSYNASTGSEVVVRLQGFLAAATACIRSAPTTWGSLSQDRIVWPDHVSRGTTGAVQERRPAPTIGASAKGEPMPAPTNRPAYQLFVGIDSAATTFAAVWT